MHILALKQAPARVLTVLFLAALFIGTLMPGQWKQAGTQPFSAWLDLAAASHVVLFALIAFLLPQARFWTLRPWHVPALGLALGALTEGLQFFAIERHPGLDGLAYDLLGTLIGWSLALAVGAPQPAAGPPASAAGPSTAPCRTR